MKAIYAAHAAPALASPLLLQADWQRVYSREEAAYPLPGLRRQKYWPPVGRVDNVYGDRNLFCSCVPLSAYAPEAEVTDIATPAELNEAARC